ncbi:MAG: cytochrome C [Pseudomonadota bacterium]|nr:cytochrome C [Pseudomonadota bacterium]
MSSPTVASWERRRRAIVVALALTGIGCFGLSWLLPWWTFHLVAPQYPKGLDLVIHLTGVQGDVFEIDIINHYIGMSSLGDAATFERAWSGWLVGGLGVAVLGAVLLAGRRVSWLAAAVAAAFPLGFVADTLYWLYQSGHDLDSHAPVRIKPFMPVFLGEGKIGQFVTTAWPNIGFYTVLVGVALLLFAVWQRARVCRVCPVHDTCGATCPHAFVGVPR